MAMIPEPPYLDDFMLCRNCKKNQVEHPYSAWRTGLVKLPGFWCECCREKFIDGLNCTADEEIKAINNRREEFKAMQNYDMASLKNENAMIIKALDGLIDGIGELRKRWSMDKQ